MCAPRSGAARSRFTRGLRPCSGFLQPAPTAELRHRHSHRAEYPLRDRATLGDAPSSPLGASVAGGEGPGALGAAEAEGTACPRPPEGCPSLPPPHTGPAAARGVLSLLPPTSRQRWRGWDAGTTPQLARGFPTSGCFWKLALDGVWAAQGGRRCQCPFPGGPEGAASPQELGWGKAAKMVRKDRPEPRKRRGGGRGWGSDPAPWVWDPPPCGWRGAPGQQRLLGGTQPGLSSPPLQGGQKCSF